MQLVQTRTVRPQPLGLSVNWQTKMSTIVTLPTCRLSQHLFHRSRSSRTAISDSRNATARPTNCANRGNRPIRPNRAVSDFLAWRQLAALMSTVAGTLLNRITAVSRESSPEILASIVGEHLETETGTSAMFDLNSGRRKQQLRLS